MRGCRGEEREDWREERDENGEKEENGEREERGETTGPQEQLQQSYIRRQRHV